MSNSSIRVRFAPSPTGIMHIGNSRTGLLNFLFAKQKNGTFILRIEDTDPARNFDPGAKTIMADLDWLDITFDEGPIFQSQRQQVYQEKLQELIEKKLVYPCFCSQQELEKKRDRQRALKIPPRYDRSCLQLSEEQVATRIERGEPYIWRFKLNHDQTIVIKDLARGEVKFELKNFSDFPLTRADGSFTFMFANFVDDMLMDITHIFRGEDHQSNTAGQAALYKAFDRQLPIFWHMPILCNIDGKKLSKRDFGFSLHDLKDAGYLPQAINNYLAIIGSSYPNEIMDMQELIKTINFDNPHATGKIKYDVEKLRWVNHQWICKLSPQELLAAAEPFILKAYPQAQELDSAELARMLQIIKTDLYTLKDAPEALNFVFETPEISKESFASCITPENLDKLALIYEQNLEQLESPEQFLTAIKTAAKSQDIPTKELFWAARLALMGSTNGPSIADLIALLGHAEAKSRLKQSLSLLK